MKHTVITPEITPVSEQHNLKLYESQPKYAGLRMYQKLPLQITNNINTNKCNADLKEILLQNAYILLWPFDPFLSYYLPTSTQKKPRRQQMKDWM